MLETKTFTFVSIYNDSLFIREYKSFFFYLAVNKLKPVLTELVGNYIPPLESDLANLKIVISSLKGESNGEIYLFIYKK